MTFDKFPFGINKEMDDHAIAQGISHWSCVSPGSNTWWVRKDGKEVSYANPCAGTYMDRLREYDRCVKFNGEIK